MLAQWKVILSQSLILTRANLKARYRNSAAGYVWVLLHPLLTYMVQGYVFKLIFKIPVDNYFVFLLFGLIPWLFFSQSLEMVTTSFYFHSRLLKSVLIHPASLILAQIFDNVLNSIIVMSLILSLLSFAGGVPWSKVWLFPLPYVSLAVATSALGFVLSSLHLRFFDTKFIVTFLINILFFVTPVIYPESFVPSHFRFLLYFNPLFYMLRPWKVLLELGPGTGFWNALAVSFLISGVFVFTTILIWRRSRNAIYLRL